MPPSRHPDFAHSAETALPGLNPAALQELLLAEAREHALDARRDETGALVIANPYGGFRLSAEAGLARARAYSPRADWLFVLKEALTEKVATMHPEAAAAIRWSDAATIGSRPPNFQFVEIRAVTPLGRDFLRITVAAEDLSAFGDDAIHFRLVLPPPGDPAPEWPRIGASGTTIWPSGAKALHRPVYTVRSIDPARGELSFDLFVHAGGRATAWAQSVRPGARIGLTGPGGGGIPQTRKITLYADETGFPAVARILESLPAEATGHAVLSAGARYPLPTHPGIALHRLAQGGATQLAERAIADRASHGGHSLWFAAEKTGAQRLRDWCRRNGVNLRDHYVAAYWTQADPMKGDRT